MEVIEKSSQQLEYQRQWRNRHRELGLCLSCNKPVVPNRGGLCILHGWQQRIRSSEYAENHRQKMAQCCKLRYDRLKSEGRCTQCGRKLNEDDEGVFCNGCRCKAHEKDRRGKVRCN